MSDTFSASQEMPLGVEGLTVSWSGLLILPPRELSVASPVIEGWDVEESPDGLLLLPKENLVVDSGIFMRLDRLFAIGGPPGAVAKMGVDNGSSNPVAGTSSSGANTKTIIGFDSVATRTTSVVSAVGTYTQALVNFAMKRLFLSNTGTNLTNSTTADAANSLHSMTNVFTIDLTAFATWSLTMTAQVTGTGS